MVTKSGSVPTRPLLYMGIKISIAFGFWLYNQLIGNQKNSITFSFKIGDQIFSIINYLDG
jgi:hypothetical protein